MVCARRNLLDDPLGVGPSQATGDRSQVAQELSGDPQLRALWICRRLCSKCGRLHEEDPPRCERCGARWGRPASPGGALELRAQRSWLRELGPLEPELPEGLRLGRARLCFSTELHSGGLDALVGRAARAAARFFYATDRGCFTLLALRVPGGLVGGLTDFPWRSRPSPAAFGEASGDCFLFSLLGDSRVVHRCRHARGALLRYTGTELEFAPAPSASRRPADAHRAPEDEAASAALTLGASLATVRCGSSELLGGGRLAGARELRVLGLACLSWAHLEGDASEEAVPLALQANQDTFLLNFIGSSVRSQLAAKAGSAWC